jgi:hypothetical protein
MPCNGKLLCGMSHKNNKMAHFLQMLKINKTIFIYFSIYMSSDLFTLIFKVKTISNV